MAIGNTIDNTIKEAIREAVSEANQPETVSRRLIKWLENLVNSDSNDSEDNNYLEMIYLAIDIEEQENNHEN